MSRPPCSNDRLYADPPLLRVNSEPSDAELDAFRALPDCPVELPSNAQLRARMRTKTIAVLVASAAYSYPDMPPADNGYLYRVVGGLVAPLGPIDPSDGDIDGNTFEHSRVCEIQELVVDEKEGVSVAQVEGVLLQAVEDFQDEFRCEVLRVVLQRDDPETIALFADRGFEECTVTRDEVSMIKHLPPSE